MKLWESLYQISALFTIWHTLKNDDLDICCCISLSIENFRFNDVRKIFKKVNKTIWERLITVCFTDLNQGSKTIIF